MADAPLSASITNLIRDSHDNSKSKGFWDSAETAETIPSKLMLIVSEMAEALESYRDPASDDMVKVPSTVVEALLETRVGDYPGPVLDILRATYEKWKAKPKGFEIELADGLIRIFDLAGKMGIDLDSALRTKMTYNRGRMRMHGGRKV